MPAKPSSLVLSWRALRALTMWSLPLTATLAIKSFLLTSLGAEGELTTGAGLESWSSMRNLASVAGEASWCSIVLG